MAEMSLVTRSQTDIRARRGPLGCGGGRVQGRQLLDRESRSWLERLRGTEPLRGWAIAELHERLCREAAFDIRRRARSLPDFPRSDVDDLATQAASDALVVLLRKLDEYRGESQFWTWARRFAQLEAPVCIRRRLGRDPSAIPRDPEQTQLVEDPGGSPQDRAELAELLRRVSDCVLGQLTPRQRNVLIAVAIDGVPADRLAAELQSSPGAIYKSLHDARAKLRLHLMQPSQ